MQKSLVAGLLSAIVFAAPALSADLPVKAPRLVAPAAYNWTGWYVGGNVGYGWGEDTGALWDSSAGFDAYFGAGGNGLPGVKPRGFIGGGQIGYNWQITSWVLGVVADLQGSDMHASATNQVVPGGIFLPSSQSNSSAIDWFGTVRGRVGFTANTWLFYGTGGLAYGRVSSDLSWNCPTCAGSVIYSGSTAATKVGWAAGAGIEYGLAPNWSLGVEYLHIDLGDISTTALPNLGGVYAGTSLTARSDFAADIVRGMVNYRF